MASIIERRNRDERERDPAAGPGSGRLGPAALTRQSWARRIETSEDLPAAYLESVVALVGGGPFPPAVLCPAVPRHRSARSEHLVLDLDGAIAVLERDPTGVQTTVHPVSSIADLELGEILLDSWLGLRGLDRDGLPARSLVRFNTVSSDLLEPFAAMARRPASAGDMPRERGLALLELQRRSLKFACLARDALRPADRVRELVFQPLVVGPHPRLGRLGVRRTRVLPALVLLTDTELIVIREDRAGPESSGGGRLGWVRRHLRLTTALAVDIRPQPDGLAVVRVAASTGEPVDVVVEAERQADLERLLGRIAAPIPQG